MRDLSATYGGWLDAQEAQPDDARYISQDGVCPVCDRLVPNHCGVEMVLSLRKIKYWDHETGKAVVKVGVPYCTC